jgi:hypothetical protein
MQKKQAKQSNKSDTEHFQKRFTKETPFAMQLLHFSVRSGSGSFCASILTTSSKPS